MAITINLKEIFTGDSASDLSGKLNFNFNQILALGVGQVGPTGPIGATGSAGPAGPIGLTGAPGSKIWSGASASTFDLTNNSPAGAVIGDYYIGQDSIYRKSTANNSTVWDIVSDFNSIFNAIAIAGTSTWQLGINSDPNSRIMVPIKNSKVNDRIITADTGSYTTNTPNWGDSTSTLQNSQGIIFNFDVETVKTLTDTGVAGLNNYTIAISGSRVGATPASINEVFPYTALLSLYSFYQAAQATTEADQYTPTTGYRHQLELGSVDNLNDELHGTANYVISPTYQNLRVRKYRVFDSTVIAGKSVICTDYNLHSDDSATKPALNSKQRWTINKKDLAASGNSSKITMALSSSIAESTLASTTGITGVDGLHFNIDGTNARSFAIGFDVNTSNLIISSTAPTTISYLRVKDMGLRVSNSTTNIDITSAGISGNAALEIGANGSTTASMTLSSTLGDVNIFAKSITKEIKIGSSAASYALGVKDNRLSTNIPMPVSTSTLPTVNSTNPNTLDEYQEGEFTPVIHYGTLSPNASVISPPIISEQKGIFTKIGKLFAFTIKFKITDFTLISPYPAITMPAPPYYLDPTILTGAVTTGNIDTVQTSANAMHEVGNERNAIQIRWDNFHWPDMDGLTSGFGTDLMKFPVSISATGTGGNLGNAFMLRSFPLNFSVGGNGPTGTSASALPMEPAEPGTVSAMFQTRQTGIGAQSLPALGLFCNRRLFHNFPTFNSITSARLGAVSTMQSRLTIWDFLNFEHPSGPAGNTINVVIHGSFLTGHKTAQQVWPTQTSNNLGTSTLNTGETI